MTAQIPERLDYLGETVALCSNPLTPYLQLHGKSQIFQMTNTANWRGYVGRWEIADDCLYLNSLEGRLKDGTDVSLTTLFPTADGRVLASWYSGTLRVPQGELINYVHLGFASRYRQDLLIEIQDGRVVATTVRDNEAKAPESTSPAEESIVSPTGKLGYLSRMLKILRR